MSQDEQMKLAKAQNQEDDNPDRIPTNLRLLLILEVIGNTNEPLTPTEINAQLGLPKQSIHRLCATLVEEGFLIYEPGGKRLRPARRFRQLAAGALFASRVHINRHQILEEVALQVGETVNFVVPEVNGMNYLDRVETNWPFRVQLPIGTNVPFHCTASGKTFLASLPPRARRKMVQSLNLKRHTPNTHTDRELLLRELEDIARKGYALDREELMEGMVAISVPVSDEKGRYMAAIAFHGPTMRLTIENMVARRDLLQDAAKRLSRAILFD